jgi:hypothetical protein
MLGLQVHGSCLAAQLSEGGPSFMADAFFLAQRYMHVALLPAVYRQVFCVGAGGGGFWVACSLQQGARHGRCG